MNRFACLAVFAAALPAAAAGPRLTWFPTPRSPQLANYDISVTLDPVQHLLTGRETIRWKNGSANATAQLKFHLYQNAFASNRTVFMTESGGQLRGVRHSGKGAKDWGYEEVTKISVTYAGGPAQDLTPLMQLGGPTVEGEKIDDTVMTLPLPLPVGPGESLEINLSFKTKLPRIFARSGYFHNYHLAGQWFPKLGVLEDSGWNCHAYHANSEFFSDYGVYDVEIKAPRHYVVAATGDLAPGSGENGTWRFHAEDVHDFAFAADPNFVRQPMEGKYVSPSDGHTVRVLVYYHDYSSGYARRHLDAAITTLEWFEKHVGPYPYPVLSVVDPAYNAGGSGGMEYPTFVTTISSSDLPALTGLRIPEIVTVHEVGHQWFYGLLGSNEFEESWLDEGLNQFSETRIMDDHYKGMIDFYGLKVMDTDDARGGYASNPSLDPTLRKSWEFATGGSYGGNTYKKTATFMQTLKHLIGEEKLDAGMRLYYQRFAFKHPHTADFIATLSEAAGQDLNPFFDTWLKSTKSLDFKVRSITSERIEKDTGVFLDKGEWRFRDAGEWQEKGKTAKPAKKKSPEAGAQVEYLTTLLIQRIGAAVLPVEFVVEFEDGSREKGVWDGEGDWKKIRWTRSCPRKEPKACRWKSVRLDPDSKLPVDLNLLNNGKQRDGRRMPALKATTRLGGALAIFLDLIGGLL